MAQPTFHAELASAAQAATTMAHALQAASAAAQGDGSPVNVQLQSIQQQMQSLQQSVQQQMQSLQQSVQQQMQSLQQQAVMLQLLMQGQQDLKDDLVPFRMAAARAHNATVVDQGQLMGVPVSVQGPDFGKVPGGFPQTRAALHGLAGQQLGNLLQAYGLVPVGPSDTARIMQLAGYIGVHLSY